MAERQHRPRVRRTVALAVVMLLAIASVIGFGQGANADEQDPTTGVSATLLVNGNQVYDGDPIVDEGDEITLRVQYDKSVGAGTAVTIGVGGPVSLTGVPAGNSAIDSITQDGDEVTVTFKSPWPAGIDQGTFDLTATVDDVDGSSKDAISWQIDGARTSIPVFVRDGGDQFASVTDGSSKTVSGGLGGASVSDDGDVSVDSDIADKTLTYTLTLDSEKARTGVSIADALGDHLAYDEDSFRAEITTWDQDGLNKSTDPFLFTPAFSGNGFTGTVDVPGADARDDQGPSILTIRYTAHVSDVAGLVADLQKQYDAMDEDKYGHFSVTLTNEASFDDATRNADVTVTGDKKAPPAPPGPKPETAFSKNASWQNKTVENTAVTDDGTLDPALDIDYTLTADLGDVAGESDFTFDRNVVITDTLPEQERWNIAGTDGLAVSGNLELNAAPAGTDCTASDFASDDHVGQYCLDAQTLRVNIGQDASTQVEIVAAAQLTTVSGLGDAGGTSVEDAVKYRVRNVAHFAYAEGEDHTAGYNSYVTVLPDRGQDGLHDESAFSKTSNVDGIVVDPGQSATIDYTFTVAEGTGVDIAHSRIVDQIDHDVFDLDDLSGVGLAGAYNWRALDADDFALSVDDDGDLVIALSDTGADKVAEWGADKRFQVTITLQTLPFEGKVTKAITNKAVLFGEDDTPLYWSQVSGEATSYGDEAEVRKRVYDRVDQEWTDTLKAVVDTEGTLVQDTYVYQVEFLPHGSYDQVSIIDVDDILPDGVEFLGFVTADDAATAANPTADPVEIGGNLQAVYDADARTVTLEQEPGTVLDASDGDIAAYFAVRVVDASQPIVNKIGTTEAVIVPQDPPSIDIEKWSDEGEAPAYDEDGALTNDGYAGDFDAAPGKALTAGATQPITFTVSNDGGDALKDLEVTDELTDGAGAISDLSCVFPDESTGTTWAGPLEPGAQFECTGTVPTLKAGQSHSDRATVTGTGIVSDEEVTDDDTWNAHVKSYAVGDYVWVDQNKDGVQDADEPVLSGVAVELLDEDGNVVATTETDEDGRYLFDQLPAGTYQVRFTLTDEQAATYEFTAADAGDSDAADSDADPTTGLTAPFVLDDDNAALTTDYDREVNATEGIDPTWDAGVVEIDEQVGPAPDPSVTPQPEPSATPQPTPVPSGQPDPTATPAPSPSTPAASAVDTGDEPTPGPGAAVNTGGTAAHDTAHTAAVALWGGLGAVGFLAAIILLPLMIRRRRTSQGDM